LLGLRLPAALLALLLFALAHQFSSCRMNSELDGLPAAEWIDYMRGRAVPNRPSARFHALPQVSHGLASIHQADGYERLPAR
jgi:hypothetical protein